MTESPRRTPPDSQRSTGQRPFGTEPAFDWARLRRVAEPRQEPRQPPWPDPRSPEAEAHDPGPESAPPPGGGRDERVGADADAFGTPPPGSGRVPDLSAIFTLLDAVRALVPRELERQFTALLREVLLTLRSLIDWYLERLDGGRGERRVEDIPID
jgi:hypothetical protein